MSEHKNAYRAGRMEGNARWPQTFSGINIFALERCFLSPDPVAAIGSLVEPLPINEELMAETETANKLHKRFGVARVLTPQQVQFNRVAANFNLLLRLGAFFSVPLPKKFEEEAELSHGADGVWAAPITISYLEAVQEKLAECSPEELKFITELFTVAAETTRARAGAEQLKKRRELYADWEEKPEMDQIDTKIVAGRMSRLTHDTVRAALVEHFSKQSMSSREQWFYDRFLMDFAT